MAKKKKPNSRISPSRMKSKNHRPFSFLQSESPDSSSLKPDRETILPPTKAISETSDIAKHGAHQVVESSKSEEEIVASGPNHMNQQSMAEKAPDVTILQRQHSALSIEKSAPVSGQEKAEDNHEAVQKENRTITTEPAKHSWSDLVSAKQKLRKKGEGFVLPSGELCVTIPNEVIVRNQSRWTNHILAQFHGKAPSPGALYAITNGIWSNRDRDISVSKLSERSFLIRIPNAVTRARVLAQGMWHIEGQSMFVAKWEPGVIPQLPVLTHVPVWLEFRGVPPQFYSPDGFEHIAGLLGEPMFLHPDIANMKNLEVGKVFTVVNLQKELPETVNAQFEAGAIQRVTVNCPWLPPTCKHCGEVGHPIKKCPTAPITCGECKSAGHLGDNCPRKKKQKEKVDDAPSKVDVEKDMVEKKRSQSKSEKSPGRRKYSDVLTISEKVEIPTKQRKHQAKEWVEKLKAKVSDEENKQDKKMKKMSSLASSSDDSDTSVESDSSEDMDDAPFTDDSLYIKGSPRWRKANKRNQGFFRGKGLISN